MNEHNSNSTQNPKASSGAENLYFLQLSSSSTGVPEAIPLHLFINEIEHGNKQYLLPLLNTNPNESRQHLNEEKILKDNAINSSDGQDFKAIITESSSPKSTQLNESRLLSTTTSSTVGVKSRHIQNQKRQSERRRNELKEKHNRNENQKECNPRQSYAFSSHIPDRVLPPRAMAVLPLELQLRRNCISPRRLLPPRVRFGPVQGIFNKIFLAKASELIIEAVVAKTAIFLLRRDEQSVLHIDVSDKDSSNWLSLLPLGDESTANVWLYEEDNELYGVTTQAISPRTPMALGYSKKYADEHKLPLGQPVLDLEEALSVRPKQWWCYECWLAFGSVGLLQRHEDVCHKDEQPARRKYRCPYCSRTFSRLFTLKRHTTKFCTKKTEKLNTIVAEQSESNTKIDEININQSTEDNRIPSDESFQNYSTGLDFSTNLFDTDRMPNLDISGSSRSESDFSPYPPGFKLDNYMDESVAKSTTDVKSKTKIEEIFIPCVHCNQTISKAKKRRHIRECPSRRFECQCGQIFRKKDDLAQHIFIKHKETTSNPSGSLLQEIKEEPREQSKDTPYKCEECRIVFKRRGMLVNHLWRAHKTVAAVPLEKRVRFYPCSICPNIYCTAAKRNRHVQVHHPGSESIRAPPIEGERRVYEPAKCPVCPRQYHTRAKLLQHQRAQHPHMAMPARTKKQLKSPIKNTPFAKSSFYDTVMQPLLGFD